MVGARPALRRAQKAAPARVRSRYHIKGEDAEAHADITYHIPDVNALFDKDGERYHRRADAEIDHAHERDEIDARDPLRQHDENAREREEQRDFFPRPVKAHRLRRGAFFLFVHGFPSLAAFARRMFAALRSLKSAAASTIKMIADARARVNPRAGKRGRKIKRR